MDQVLQEFDRIVEVGDAVLSAADDPLSKVIRIGSRAPYSHAAIITRPGEMTEAYDHALTPSESDDGIYALTTTEYLERTGLRRVLVLRPTTVDRSQVTEVAAYLRRHSPGFPTIGMLCLALCGLSSPLLRKLPAGLEHWATMKQVRQAADGVRRMHCAETLARIYLASGVPLRFREPRLSHHIEHLTRSELSFQPVGLPATPRVADPGHWPEGPPLSRLAARLGYGLRSTFETWLERARAEGPIDIADLILPGDFLRAEPFEPVAQFKKTSSGWTRVAAA